MPGSSLALMCSVIAALKLLTGCSDENSRARGEFLSGCVQSGASKAICQCTFQKLEAKYSPAQLRSSSNPDKLLQDVMIAART
ncbi:hypothetical protein CUN63_08580 [Pseudomonas sp. ACM7]|nr:hypothetical protein CUN63_08580 [Pseudomonas sp. ACM7]